MLLEEIVIGSDWVGLSTVFAEENMIYVVVPSGAPAPRLGAQAIPTLDDVSLILFILLLFAAALRYLRRPEVGRR